MVGTGTIRLQAANDGTVALFDEGDGLRWLVAPEPAGTGISILDDGGTSWGTDFTMRGGERTPRRTFGPTWFEVEDVRHGLALTRTILCPEGDVPWLLVRVQLRLARSAAARSVRHVEQWRLRPRFANTFESPALRTAHGDAAVTYDVATTANGLVAHERFAAPADPAPAGPIACSAAARSIRHPPTRTSSASTAPRAIRSSTRCRSSTSIPMRRSPCCGTRAPGRSRAVISPTRSTARSGPRTCSSVRRMRT